MGGRVVAARQPYHDLDAFILAAPFTPCPYSPIL
jgi:hypothetical protein